MFGYKLLFVILLAGLGAACEYKLPWLVKHSIVQLAHGRTATETSETPVADVCKPSLFNDHSPSSPLPPTRDHHLPLPPRPN